MLRSQYFAVRCTMMIRQLAEACRRPEPGSVSQARQALLRFTAPITMGGDEPIAPPPLEEVVNALKVLAYHPAGGGATESHRAHLYSAALAFLQILRDDGRTLRCACVGSGNLQDER